MMNKTAKQVPMSLQIERAVKALKKLPMADKIDLLVKANLISPAKAESAKAKLRTS